MKKYIIANWKMNCSKEFVENYANSITKNINHDINFIIAPSHPYLELARSLFNQNIGIAGQDCSEFENGAYTGQISAKNLLDFNCQYCIIGHSESRKFLKYSDSQITGKLSILAKYDITPIYCIGENLKTREDGRYIEFLESQLKSIPSEFLNKQILIAYEPIWAIGSGVIPSSEQIQEVADFIKEFSDKNNFANAGICYGGSVSTVNYQEILDIQNISGLLIGGMALKVGDVNSIIEG